MTKLTGKRILLLLLVTPLLLALEFMMGVYVFDTVQKSNKAESQNSKLDLYLRTNTKYISYAESAQRGYLLTGDASYRENIKNDIAELKKNEEYYDTMPGNTKSNAVKDIRKLSARKMTRLNSTIALYDAGDKDSALAIVKTGVGQLMMDSLRKMSTAIRDQITVQSEDHRQRQTQLFHALLGVILGLIFFTLFIVWFTYMRLQRYTNTLETAVKSLQEANERMGRFTYMSYHELKTPLRNISGFAQLLKKRHSADISSEDSDFVSHITEGVKQLDQTINEMRDKYLQDGDMRPNGAEKG